MPRHSNRTQRCLPRRVVKYISWMISALVCQTLWKQEMSNFSFWIVKNASISYASLIYSRALPSYTPDFYQYFHHICFPSIFSSFHHPFDLFSFFFLPLHCSLPSSSFQFLSYFCIPLLLSSLSTLFSLQPFKSFCSLFSHLYLFPGCEFSFFHSPPSFLSIFCLLELKWYSSHNLPEKRGTSFKSIVHTKGMESISKRAKWLFQSLPWTNKCSFHWQLEEFSAWVKLLPICYQ